MTTVPVFLQAYQNEIAYLIERHPTSLELSLRIANLNQYPIQVA